MLQPKQPRSRLYTVMLMLCCIYACMSLAVLGMHIFAYAKFLQFNDAVAGEIGNRTDMTPDMRDVPERMIPPEFANGSNLLNDSNVRYVRERFDHRPLNPDFFSSTRTHAQWLFAVLITVSAIGVVLPIVVGLLLHHLSSARAIAAAQESTMSLLTTPDEKRIIELLRVKGGALTQSEIVTETGLTKVKVHRVLTRLLTLGLVEKHPYGMTNKIVLIDQTKL